MDRSGGRQSGEASDRYCGAMVAVWGDRMDSTNNRIGLEDYILMFYTNLLCVFFYLRKSTSKSFDFTEDYLLQIEVIFCVV